MAERRSYSLHHKFTSYHTGQSVQVTGDGVWIICYTKDKISALNVDTGKVETEMLACGEEDEVMTLRLSPDNQMLVVALRSGTQKLLSWPTLELKRSWKTTHELNVVKCFAFDDTSTLLASGGSVGSVKVYHLQNNYYTHSFIAGRGVYSCLVFLPDCSRIFGASEDYDIQVLDLGKKKAIAQLSGHHSSVTCLALTNKGLDLISSGRDQVVIVWDVHSLSQKRVIIIGEAIEGFVLIPSQDISNPVILTCGSEGCLKSCSPSGPLCVHTYKKQSFCGLSSITYCKSRNWVIVTSNDHNIYCYNVQLNDKLTDLELTSQYCGNLFNVSSICHFGKSDSQLVMATGETDLRICARASLKTNIIPENSKILSSVTLSAKLLITGGTDDLVKIWQYDAGTNSFGVVATGEGHTSSVTCVAADRKSTSSIFSGSRDCCVRKWNVPKILKRNNEVTLDAEWTRATHAKPVYGVCVCAAYSCVAACGLEPNIKLLRISDGSPYGTLLGHKGAVCHLDFHPSDPLLLSGGRDNIIRIWNIKSLTCVKMFHGHESTVHRAFFISGGKQLVSCDHQGIVKIWNTGTLECVTTLHEHAGPVTGLSVADDGAEIVTGGEDATVIVWKDVTAEANEAVAKSQEEELECIQLLSNLVKRKKYQKALILATDLKRPYESSLILNKMKLLDDGSERLSQTVKVLSDDQLGALVSYIATWNTNFRLMSVSQWALNIVLHCISRDRLLSLAQQAQHLEALLAYSERHFAHFSYQLQNVAFLQYTSSLLEFPDLSV